MDVNVGGGARGTSAIPPEFGVGTLLQIVLQIFLKASQDSPKHAI